MTERRLADVFYGGSNPKPEPVDWAKSRWDAWVAETLRERGRLQLGDAVYLAPIAPTHQQAADTFYGRTKHGS